MYQLFLAVAFFAAATVTTTTSCNSNQPQSAFVEANKGEEIPYTLAQNYFVVNTYVDGQLTNPKITSQETFDQYFGMAPLAKEGGQPTTIDFSKQYVIAVIGEESSLLPTMEVKSLKKNDKGIELKYEYKLNTEAGFTIRPVLLLIVDNKYTGDIHLVK